MIGVSSIRDHAVIMFNLYTRHPPLTSRLDVFDVACDVHLLTATPPLTSLIGGSRLKQRVDCWTLTLIKLGAVGNPIV